MRRRSRLWNKIKETINVLEYNIETDQDDVIVSDIEIHIKLLQTPEDIQATGQFIESGKYIGVVLKPNALIRPAMIVQRAEDKHPRRLNIISQQTIADVQQLVMEIII